MLFWLKSVSPENLSSNLSQIRASKNLSKCLFSVDRLPKPVTESTEYYPTSTSSFLFETDITFGVDSFEVCPECENGGVCNDDFECDCLGDFTGDLCEGDPCSWTPCLNNGACTVSNVTYECACTEGYYGRQCEITPCHIAGGTPIPETKSSSRQRREEMILGQKAISGWARELDLYNNLSPGI